MPSLRSRAFFALLMLLTAGRQPDQPPAAVAAGAACGIVSPRAVGTQEGSFSVNASGGATYTMDIDVPPGTHGVAPKLSIWYVSQSAEGLLGNGFALEGLSSITRCQASLKLDGYNGGVGFDAKDRFCLDGQRLVKIAGGGEYGAAGSVYHTENETWTQVTAVGTCGSGPCSFTAQNKDGSTLQFGTGNSGTPLPNRPDIASWQIASITDVNGNRVSATYKLNPATLQNLPTELRYTENAAAGVSATRKITFDYEPRSQQTPRYVGGYLFKLTDRLKAIRTWLDGSEVLDYFLSYTTSDGTGRDLLCSFQKCTPAGECYPATTFAYSQETNALTSPNSSADGTLRSGWCTEANAIVGWSDFNGDGLPDVHCDTESGTHRVLLSTGSGLVSPNANVDGLVKTGWCAGTGFIPSWVDFNGDGKSDLACDGSDGTHRVLVSNGSTVSSPNSSADGMIKTSWCGGDSSRPQWGNFNADGRADLLCSSKDGVQRALLSTGTGVVSPNSSADGVVRTGWCTATDAVTFWGDFNGDHLSDAHCATPSGVQQVLLSNGTQLVSPNSDASGTVATSWCAGSGRHRGATDFNNDGLLDSTCDADDGRHWVLLSTGRDLVSPNSAADGLLKSSWCTGSGASTTWADFNGDGLADMQCRDGGGRLLSLLSTGTGLRSPNSSADGVIKTGWCPSDKGAPVWTDFNADSLDDVTCHSGGLQQALVHVPGAPDLVNKITDGIGMTVDITYAPLTDPNVYTTGSAVTYPTLEVRSPMYVVSRYVTGDGRGALYPVKYSYKGARTDLESQRWMGFEQVTFTQETVGRTTVTNYLQEYPLLSFVSSTSVVDAQKRTLASTTYTPLIRNPFPNVFEVFPKTESSSTFTGGVADYTLTKTYDYDDFGNENYEADVSDPYFAVYTCRKFKNSTNPWRLGYPAGEKTTRTNESCRAFILATDPVWDPANDLRWTTIDYDDRMNPKTQQTWDDGNNKFLKQGRTFDAVGNLLTQTDLAGHVTTYAWDETHTFPTSQTSPALADGRHLTTTFTFHRAFGAPATTTDPNGNVDSQFIDGFGRLIEERGPDPAASTGAATVSLRKLTYAQDASGRYTELRERQTWADGDVNNWFYARQYIDGLGRVYLQKRRSARANDDVVIETLYDTAGREWKESVPHYSTAGPAYVETLYDLLDRPTHIIQPDGTVTRKEYLRGEIEMKTTEAYGTDLARTTIDTNDPRELSLKSIAPNSGITTSQYDPVGQILSNVRATGSSTVTTWDSLGRPVRNVDSNTGTTTWTYGTDGLMHLTTNGAGATVQFEYDSLDRPKTRTIESSNAAKETYTFAYDNPALANAQGNLTTVTGPSYSEDYSYSRYSQRAVERLTLDGNVYVDKADYDPAGQPSLRTFPDGSLLRTTHFVDGTIESLDLKQPGDPQFVNYAKYTSYSALQQPEALLYGNGLRTDTTYYPVKESMARPHVMTLTRQSNPASTLMTRSYTWSRLTELQTLERTDHGTPLQPEHYVHNNMGWLTSVSGPAGDSTYEYDLAGNVTKKDGVTYTYAPKTDRMKDGTNGSAFEYDGAGYVSRKQVASKNWKYQHDGAGRLRDILLNDSLVGRHLYDKDDSRIRRIDGEGNVSIYIAEDIDLYKSGSSLLLTKYVQGVTGPIAAVTTPYTPQTLKAMLERQKTALDADRYDTRSLRGLASWTGAKFRQMLSAAGRFVIPLSALFCFAITSLLLFRLTPYARRHRVYTAFIPFLVVGLVLLSAEEMRADLGPGNGYPTAGTVYFHGDQVDSTIVVTRPDGSEATRINYTAFGGVDQPRSSGPNNFRPKFTSKEHDHDSELDYFGSRYYDSQIGRFLEPDPQSQFASAYVYGGNDPVDMYDPDGQLAFLAVVLIAAAVGGVVGAYFGGVAVNDNTYNPFQWDWGSGRTLAGIFAGAAIGAASAAIGVAIGGASVAAGIAAEIVLAAGENAAFTAMAGGSGKDILFSALLGAGTAAIGSFVGAGLSAALGSASRSGSRLARRAEGEMLSAEAESASNFANVPCMAGIVPGASFVAGTLVSTAAGLEPIEEVTPGESVAGKADEPSNVIQFPVLSTFTRHAPKLVDVNVGSTKITSTPEHPFWVESKGWTEAANLKPNDLLVTEGGDRLPVAAVNTEPAGGVVYNFRVDQSHDYFVSPLRVLVHNPSRCTRATRKKMLKKGVDTDNIIEGRRTVRRPARLGAPIRRYGPAAPRLPGGRYVDFGPVASRELRILLTGSNAADFTLADRLAGITKAYRRRYRFTWHHVEDVVLAPGGGYRGTLQLVPTDVHQQWPHWGGENRYRQLTGGGYGS